MATKFTYTENEIQQVVAKYKSGVSLDVLATDHNKSVASIRMKLVKLGVYQKPATTTKTVTKSENTELFYKCLAAVGETQW